MNPLNWEDQLHKWLKRHPLKRYPEGLQQNYTKEVMARIGVSNAPPSFRPRPRFVYLGVFGGVLCLAGFFLWFRGPSEGSALQMEKNESSLAKVADALERNGRELEKEIQLNEQWRATELFSDEEELLPLEKTLGPF